MPENEEKSLDPLLALSAELPELPEPVAFLHNIPRNALFSADQMRAYATEAVLRAANARGDGDRADAEMFRYMEKHAAGWFSHTSDHRLPRIVIKPYFTDKDGDLGSLIVGDTDGVGICSLRTAVRLMQEATPPTPCSEARS